jgi:hypothetical protein
MLLRHKGASGAPTPDAEAVSLTSVQAVNPDAKRSIACRGRSGAA